MKKQKIYKWGIIAPGKIAEKFASDLKLAKGCALSAVASRTKSKAEAFALKHNAPKSYGSYSDLLSDPDVDIVYIASPHVFHFEYTMMCLEAGKHVLCEKPLAMNYKQAETMIKKARENGLYLSEGLWTRFIPATRKLLELIHSERLGKIHLVKADFGFKAPFDPAGRLFDPSLGGGSLLDIGIYPIFLSLLLQGEPSDINALAEFSETGADTSCSMLFDFDTGAKAILDSNLKVNTATEAWIYGEKAALKMHSRFHHSTKLSLYESHEETEVYELPYRGFGYVHEAEAAVISIAEGHVENPNLPHALSLQLIRTLDRVREKIGLSY